ncbi:MAG: hypothetical protein AB7P40_24980 [Chloroflexota bacterium]
MPAATPADDQFERILAALGDAIEGLDGLGLADEHGRVVIEPASAFHWD